MARESLGTPDIDHQENTPLASLSTCFCRQRSGH